MRPALPEPTCVSKNLLAYVYIIECDSVNLELSDFVSFADGCMFSKLGKVISAVKTVMCNQ